MKNIRFLISLAFFVFIFSVSQTSYSMEDFKLEKPDSPLGIKKETDVMLEPFSENDKKAPDKRISKHPSSLELSYQPVIHKSTPLIRSKTPPSSSLKGMKEGFLKPQTPPPSSGDMKVVIMRKSPDLMHECPPVMRTNATPLKLRTPSPSNLQEMKEGFFKPQTPPPSSGGMKVIIRKSPDLMHECSPLMSTNATPLRPRTPSPSNPQEMKEDFFKS